MKNQLIVEHIIYEFFGKGDLSNYELMVAENIRIHLPQSWQYLFDLKLEGRELVKKIDNEVNQAFHFDKIRIIDLMIDHQKILARWEGMGLYTKNLFSLKTSKKSFHLTGQTLYQFNHKNQVEEVWQAWDMLGLLKQIEIEQTQVPDSTTKNQLNQKWLMLSEKEQLCIKHLLNGKTAKDTAASMHLSFRTVEYYFENIKNKINCHKKKELFAFARQLEKYEIIEA